MDVTAAGHLFVVSGDLNAVDCDAVLVPVDRSLHTTGHWSPLLGREGPGRLDHKPFPDSIRAMPYEGAPAHSPGPQVWLGDIGRVSAPDRWYADGLVEFVQRASEVVRGSTGARPTSLAVNVAGSGAGGSEYNKGHLYNTILPAMVDAARKYDVDVVLVCWGAKSYAAAQRARRDVVKVDASAGDPLVSTELAETASRLADACRRDSLVLFLGAGVSMGAGLKSWQGLLDSLLESAEGTEVDKRRLRKLDVRDQAAIIKRLFGDDARYQDTLIKDIGSQARYSLAHGLLASLGTRENVTTNYDTLFETAATASGRHCSVLPYEPAVPGGQWLLKLHGSIGRDDLVLTRDDYLGLPSRAGALFGVLQAMLLTKHLLFVGYSLTDDSFHNVMHEVRQALPSGVRKLGTALVLFEDPLLVTIWEDVLDIVPMLRRDDPNADPTVDELAVAARTLDLVLDRVCAESADVSSFLLDRSYEKMLDPDERELATALRAVYSRSVGSGSPIAARVRDMLADLGASD